jgi:cytidylate kinase
MTIVIAIDGPAGSGKSSVSKQAARELCYGYLDTGAAYRALAWWATSEGLEAEALAARLGDFDYSISTNPDDFWVRVGETDVTDAIRKSAISEAVSAVARIPEVRTFMKQLSRSIIEAEKRLGIVVEGRDITTVVAPDAEVRLLLTADEAVRIKRRSAELSVASQQITKQVTDRDASDLKVVDFITPAVGVELIDSTELDLPQTVQAVLSAVSRQLAI